MERLSGVSLLDVQVRRDSPAPARFQALAHATGNEIHLAPGQGRHLAHEAWHVVQQKQKRVRATAQLGDAGLNDDAALEREADSMGARAARGVGTAPEATRPAVEGSAQPAPAARASALPVVQRVTDVEAANRIRGAWLGYASRMRARSPSVSDAARRHVHVGDERGDKAHDGTLWDGGGLHHLGELRRRSKPASEGGEGVTIDALRRYPSGAHVAVVTKPSYPMVPGGKLWGGGRKGNKKGQPYTLYPRNVPPLQSDVLAQAALDGAKLHAAHGGAAHPRAPVLEHPPPGTAQLGRFEADVPLPPRPAAAQQGRSTSYVRGGTNTLRVQGHFTGPPGAEQIASHYPMPSPMSDPGERRYWKHKREGNWQKLQKLGYIESEEAGRMKEENRQRRERRRKLKKENYLKGVKRPRADPAG